MTFLIGKVKHNVGRGKELGYPTANIDVPQDFEEGIYVGYTSYDNEHKLQSLIFIGASITFGETEKKGEVYILQFDKDIYGKEITVELLKKLRDNKKFDTKEELIAQMAQDEKDAHDFFSKQ